ncbi:MAG: pyruvate kinase [Eubacteriales bacterium]|uniref:pyruvate kinase n=1 Tax=Fenollaria sp. TaxID=1965292 RepID=UPI002A765D7D|nr:pyruvate kinase [Fenollaria sp.]MDD7340153.1 pyruvate kinase [Eubacteriales bacterium]MDY3105577.1 pyruvate kinase [Fenollaria sp.]
MKKTKIVCTIGPSSDSYEVLKALINEGMNVARLNFSHGTHPEHKKRIDTIKKLRDDLDEPIAIMLDTKGPEIRIKTFKNGMIRIEQGQDFTLTSEDVEGDETRVSVTYKDIAKDLKANDRVLIDDGLVEFTVISVDEKNVYMKAVNAGELSDRKGVNLPSVKVNLPTLTEKDIEDLIFGIENDVDFIAASFIRSAKDVLEIRKILESNGGDDIKIISKIENLEGVQNIDEIIDVSDGIMVARGDMGVELDEEDIPLVQKDIIRKCNLKGKFVITATQMLDSMIRNPRPTRAEVTDVANAILDGSSAIMLSGETAAGNYPVKSCEMMRKIAVKIEDSLDYKIVVDSTNDEHEINITNSIAKATREAALDLDAKVIIAATTSGLTARNISKFKPKSPIIAATTNEKVRRQLAIEWGVYPIRATIASSIDDLFYESINILKNIKFVKEGELVILTAGMPLGKAGSTNIMMVKTVGKLLCKGMGIGKHKISARACVAKNAKELEENFNDGDIIVTIGVYKDMLPYIQKSSGIITVEGGLTSQGAIVGINYHLATVVGAWEAMNSIKTGDIISIDATTGEIYEGKIFGEEEVI